MCFPSSKKFSLGGVLFFVPLKGIITHNFEPAERHFGIDIVSEIDTPAMRWLLRNFPKASYSSLPNMDGTDSLLITPQAQESPALASSYRGQSFVWKTFPGWPGVLPEDFIRWLNYREAPLFQENIILWVRSDLFPGGNLPVQFDLTPSLEEEVLP